MYFAPALVAAAFAAFVGALPTEPPPEGCTESTGYNVTSKTSSPILGSASSVIAMTCDGTGGDCTLGATYSYSVSMTISVGLGLNLAGEDIESSAGLDAGFTYTTTKGNAASASLKCPSGPWICGVSITPWVAKVSGFKYQEMVGLCGSNAGKIKSADPYTVEFPQVIDHLPNVNAKVCTCPNGPSPHASGAPALCPTAC